MGSSSSSPVEPEEPQSIEPQAQGPQKGGSSTEAVLFVFYKSAEGSNTWKYGRFPKGWWWVGAGSTSAVGDPSREYPREEQFNGPKETQKAMRDYLDQYFQRLKDKGQVVKYKIRNSYLP
jgi:hypothetical protein